MAEPLWRRDYAPFDLFQWLSPAARQAFKDEASQQRYGSGRIIYLQGEAGDYMFRVISGSVRLSVMHSDGRELLYRLFEPGDCFGESSMVDAEPRPHTTEAQGDVEVAILRRAAYQRLRLKHREIDDALLRLLARHMRMLSGYVADAYLTELESRVAARILAVAESFGIKAGSSIKLNVPLSQSDIASMVGVSRQSVNKILQNFQNFGFITIGYGTISVDNVAKLRSMIK